MTATLGYVSLLTAPALAVWGIVAPPLGARAGRPALFATARAAIAGQFALVTVASLALIYALVTTDFSIKYVALNTTRATPIYYRVTGLWGALEGSLRLWEWILIIFSGVVAWTYRDRHRELMPWVLMVFSVVSAFFLAVMAFASNPFERIVPAPLDGHGLNPLLEDANMLTHPPLVYTGFVGLTVPYAFAMAALVAGKLDEAWILTTRRWTIIAWLFLTLGNLVGAWWSYHVLGWGGYWAWDPVENAAFMPWLPATAFLHSIQRIQRDLSFDDVVRIEEWRAELPGVAVEVEPRRGYVSSRFAAHLLGYVREASRGQVREGRYRSGELVGQSGLEQLLDEFLRGREGGESVEVDTAGRLVRPIRREEPRAGANVVSTVGPAGSPGSRDLRQVSPLRLELLPVDLALGVALLHDVER